MWQWISICSPIIWPNLQNSDNPSPPLWLYPKFTIICVSKAAVSVEDPHIKSMQKLVSFLVPSACVTACCQPQLLEHQVQQSFFPITANVLTGQQGSFQHKCVWSHTDNSCSKQLFVKRWGHAILHLTLSYHCGIHSVCYARLKTRVWTPSWLLFKSPSLDPCLLTLIFEAHHFSKVILRSTKHISKAKELVLVFILSEQVHLQQFCFKYPHSQVSTVYFCWEFTLPPCHMYLPLDNT